MVRCRRRQNKRNGSVGFQVRCTKTEFLLPSCACNTVCRLKYRLSSLNRRLPGEMMELVRNWSARLRGSLFASSPEISLHTRCTLADISGRSRGSTAERLTTNIRHVLRDEILQTGGDDGQFSRLHHLGFPESDLFLVCLPCQEEYSPDVACYHCTRACGSTRVLPHEVRVCFAPAVV
jgi:hypothetical protein